MDPKKMLIRPEKTAAADERKAAAEAEEAAEEEELQQHYAHLDQLLDVAEKNPEAVKAAGEEIGVDYSFEAENPGLMRTGFKILQGKPISEKEDAAFREQGPPLREVLGESIRKQNAKKTPEARAKTAKMVRKMMRNQPSHLTEKFLRELDLVDSEEPSEPEKKKA